MRSYSYCQFERFVSCVFLSLLFGLPALAQISSIPDSMSQTGLGGINSIVGTVFGPTGRPIESRVRVQLSSMMSGGRTTTTNENGSFAFRGLPAGTYTISVEKEKEYEPTSHSVDIITFRGSPPQTYTLNIRLAPTELRDIVADCTPAVTFVHPSFDGVLGGFRLDEDYEALLGYNCAHSYALSVALLADRLR